ncbi:MAG: 3'-5' exonuclease [Chloroflexaceae bacterium]|nr:3'-5' exonuclease [Chloroflexaceae bacterium]
MLFDLGRRQKLPDWALPYIEAPRPNDQLSWRKLSFSVIDIETSGLNARRDVPISLGLVDIEKGRIQLDQSWYTLIRPAAHVVLNAESIRVHGLLREELEQAPTVEEVFPQLLERLAGRVLVVHMAAIDVQFLSRMLKQHWGFKLRGPALDTSRLAGMLHYHDRLIQSSNGEAPTRTTLTSLAQDAGLPVYTSHHALGDALTTAQLFLVQATRLERRGIDSLRKLLRAGGCLP